MAAAAAASWPREKYDVFLSFRGEDTRNTFTSHLYKALCQENILTYKDDEELERGDDISPALLKAISESKLSVIIFSKDYASSTWCLDELVHILRCRGEQFVIPIFYGIDPSHVRKQSGSYADAFVKHEERFKDTKEDKVLAWRNALTTAANISGFDSQTIGPESELVTSVVNDILAKLNRKLQIARVLEGLVGMDKHIIQLVELLCLNSRDVQIVGIWGMGGIGKTTIADVVFHRLSFEFEARCFIKDVREKASETKDGLPYDLRNDLFRTLLKDEKIRIDTPSIGSTFMRDRLGRTKALIVLDDVSKFSQLEFLAGGDFNLFGPGSRILVTTRNKRIFSNGEKIYEVKELDVDEALELFYSRAFRNISPPGDYTTFAKEVVDYAGGNPLALTILGPVFYHCQSKEDWKGELDRLKNCGDEDIQKVLRFSYDGLRENDKQIFLDIACCHKGKHMDEAKRILDACGFSANAGVRLLIDMSLISVDKYSRFIKMHDLIQEMGRKIVRDQDVKYPGKRSRLWNADDVCRVLKKKEGTEAIECISMNMDLITDLHVNAASFKKMNNLRLLDFTGRVNKVHLPPGFKFLPEGLKYLRWHSYPLTSLPSRFSSENLVELDMRGSRLKQLWNKGVQINLGSLKRIDLRDSEHLAEVPDLFESPNLESINLYGCRSLVQLPSSFQHLAKLTGLDLQFCSNLTILPEMPGNLETLRLYMTAIEQLPSSIWLLEKLHYLELGECEKLKNLASSSTCRLNSLLFLRLYGCLSLESLPAELPCGLTSLDLRHCESLRSLPVELPSGLKRLDLSDCKSLGSLPVELPAGLNTLVLSNCKRLGSLPVELPAGLNTLDLSNCKRLGSLPVELPAGLNTLDLSNCKRLGSLPVELPSGLHSLSLSNCESLGSLPKLPWLLGHLAADGCTSLETVRSSMSPAPIQGWNQYVNDKKTIAFGRQEELSFVNCVKLDQSARSDIMADAQVGVKRNATVFLFLESRRGELEDPWSINIVCPGSEIPEWMMYQSKGSSINIKLPPHSFRQGFLGYALCIVVAFNNYKPPPDIDSPKFCCETHLKTNNGDEDWYGSLPGTLRGSLSVSLRDDIILKSDHVFVWYICPDFFGSESTIDLEDWVKASEVSFDFTLYQCDEECFEQKPLDLSTASVEKCGVSLLYDDEEDSLLYDDEEEEVEDIIIKTKRLRLN